MRKFITFRALVLDLPVFLLKCVLFVPLIILWFVVKGIFETFGALFVTLHEFMDERQEELQDIGTCFAPSIASEVREIQEELVLTRAESKHLGEQRRMADDLLAESESRLARTQKALEVEQDNSRGLRRDNEDLRNRVTQLEAHPYRGQDIAQRCA